MNDLRIPVVTLIVIVVALGAWFYLVHQAASPAPQTASTATTTASTAVQAAPSTEAGAPPNEDTVATNIPGVWQSTDDANYSVDITSNGEWTDEYKGATASDDIKQTGTYTFFTSANPDPGFTGTIVPGVAYIRLVEGSDTYYYSVIEANGKDLQLSYLARGNTLSFTKVQ